VHIQDRNHADAAALLSRAIGRSSDATSLHALVIVPTPDDALRFAERRADEGAVPPLVPITSPVRGRRLLAANPLAVVGAPSELAPLLRESRLRLSDIGVLVLIWPEELLGGERVAELEALLAEVPRTTERTAIIARKDAAVDEFLDRVMWRARRVEHAMRVDRPPVPLRFVVAERAQRLAALRAVLDALDPDSTALVASSDDSLADARRAAAVLWSGATDSRLVIGVPADSVSLAVCYGDVPEGDLLAEVAARARDVVAIVEPARVAALRAASGGAAAPFIWSGSLAVARSALDALRSRLRDTVEGAGHLPWIPVIEPLLAELDAVEVAAASLALYDRERRKVKAVVAEPPRPPVAARGVREGASGAPQGRDREERPGRRPFDRRPPRDRAESDSPGRRQRPAGEGGRGPGRRPDEKAPRGRGPGRPGRPPIERVPRAAREGEEWARRGERLRHSRRDHRRGDNE
jgi:hypothetical protein